MVLGQLPVANWRFNFQYLRFTGLQWFHIGDFDPVTNQMNFLRLNLVHA
jgi:hypothetical protein